MNSDKQSEESPEVPDDPSDSMAHFFNLVRQTKQAQVIVSLVLDQHHLAEFNKESFDQALRNILTPHYQPLKTNEPQGSVQYLRGSTLLLPHFTEPRELSHERAKIIQQAWGKDGSPPPVVKWADVNVLANTGYQSFIDLFRSELNDFFIRVAYGKYQLRRKT